MDGSGRFISEVYQDPAFLACRPLDPCSGQTRPPAPTIRAIFLPGESKNDPLSTGSSVSRVDLCFAISRDSFGRDVGFRRFKLTWDETGRGARCSIKAKTDLSSSRRRKNFERNLKEKHI